MPYTAELLGGATQAELSLGGEAVGTGTQLYLICQGLLLRTGTLLVLLGRREFPSLWGVPDVGSRLLFFWDQTRWVFFFFLCSRGELALLAPAATDISVTKEGSVS